MIFELYIRTFVLNNTYLLFARLLSAHLHNHAVHRRESYSQTFSFVSSSVCCVYMSYSVVSIYSSFNSKSKMFFFWGTNFHLFITYVWSNHSPVICLPPKQPKRLYLLYSLYFFYSFLFFSVRYSFHFILLPLQHKIHPYEYKSSQISRSILVLLLSFSHSPLFTLFHPPRTQSIKCSHFSRPPTRFQNLTPLYENRSALNKHLLQYSLQNSFKLCPNNRIFVFLFRLYFHTLSFLSKLLQNYR